MNMMSIYKEPGLKGRVIERPEGLFVALEYYAYNREPLVEEYPIMPTNTYLEDGMLISFSLTGDFSKGGAIVPKFAILEKIIV
jgi:hypothetical protein